uniref:Uncharacterized protein n=1 Tax=Arundo donax TaxID=35708 RepID=A0A0A9HEH9_ARUDO
MKGMPCTNIGTDFSGVDTTVLYYTMIQWHQKIVSQYML